MANHELDRIMAGLSVGVPSAIMAMLGALGYHLTKDDPQINTKQLVGIMILAGFTGGITCGFLMQTGLHPELAAVTASAIGSGGVKGYEWLLKRASHNGK
jgi:uncharacterized membrane protein (DUF441 family)